MDDFAGLSHHFGLSVAIVHILQTLKKSKLCPWLSADSDKINRVVAGVLAFVSSAGISFSGNLWTGGTITVPSLQVMMHGMVEFATQLGMQQMYYKGAVKPKRSVASLPGNTPHNSPTPEKTSVGGV
jgi:hypothetical protein